MTEISIDQVREIGEYWLIYLSREGGEKHIQLSACANNFSIHRGCEPGDGLKCVGLRREDASGGSYELFNVGHTKLLCPWKAGIGGTIAALLKGKKPADVQREKFLDFERQLNSYGWKTIEE